MAKQMEIHPDRNDVINTVESTFLSCMGKPSHAGISANSSVHMCNSIHEKKGMLIQQKGSKHSILNYKNRFI